MSRAALVSAWGRRRHPAYAYVPGVVQAAPVTVVDGGDGGPIGLTVEIYLGDAGWEDITSFVYYRDRVRITRGKPDETSKIQPQTCQLTINNRDGRFSPRNPLSPYYGLIGRNTQLRVSRMQNGVRRYRFCGEVVSWPSTWDISGSDVYVPLQAAGMLRRLQQGSTPLQSVMRREVPTSPLVAAYWPCEDAAGSTQIASGIGGAAMQVAGTLNAAAYSGFAASDPLPVLGADSWTGPVPSAATGTSGRINFFVNIPAGTTIADLTPIASMSLLGGISRVDILYRSTSSATLRAYDTAGALIEDSGVQSITANGNTQRITVNWDLNGTGGTNLSWGLIGVTGPLAGFGSNIGTYNLPQMVTGVRSVTVAPGGQAAGVSVGHIWVQGTSAEPAFTSGTDAVLTGIANWIEGFAFQSVGVFALQILERPAQRIIRLCIEQGIGAEIVNGSFGSNYGAVVMGVQGVDTFGNLLQSCADADLSLLYESRNQLAVALRTRVSMYNQAPRLTLDYALNQFAAPLNPTDDDAYTRNDITVQRANGSSAVAKQTGGSLSTQAPPAGVGDYPTSLQINVISDAVLPDQAHWRLHLGTVDEPRYPQLQLNLRHPQFTGNVDLLNEALTVDIGDLVVVNNPPPWMPPDPIRQILQGYSETLDVYEHDMVLNCSPASPYTVGILEDPVLSRADTDGSTLASAMSAPLNPNPGFTGGSLTSWTGKNSTLAAAGSGQAIALPPGAIPQWGVQITPTGVGEALAFQTNARFPAQPGTGYNVSALVYSPAGFSAVKCGIDWWDASGSFISTTATPVAVPAGTWTALTATGNAPSNAATGSAQVGLSSSGSPQPTDLLYVAVVPVWSGGCSVASTNPLLPLWTTNPSAFPFDIACGGERLTVTSITGASSPQAFTVARAVNGVLKPQTPGTDVRLWQPTIVSL